MPTNVLAIAGTAKKSTVFSPIDFRKSKVASPIDKF
jgi:hypothetical protein